jgi:patatin-related protein
MTAGSDTPPRPHGAAWGSWTEEVRLAMAWNGGVSLAVWMGGVAVELDAARRVGVVEGPVDPKADPPRVVGVARTTNALYAALCHAFDRRLVIDILAGASAGGLNGALMAGSIAHRRKLTPAFMRERWLEIGDFGKLLQAVDNPNPTSIMQGEVFYTQLKKVFEDLLGRKGPPPQEVRAAELPVLLDVQATDVEGEERSFIDDWGKPFFAREYRSPVKFRSYDDYDAHTLAAAARASASFPAAFEPQRLTGVAAKLAGFEGETRWAIDGGLLENAPIRPAIELIPRRRAAAPTKRFVCYVNAAPTAHADPSEDPSRPTLAAVIGYAVNLPRDGRVIDQLNALEDATRRAGTTADAGVRLLALPAAALEQTATVLLPTYQRRRALLSLEEVLGPGPSDDDGAAEGSGPGRARQVLALLDEDAAAAAPADAAAGMASANGAALLPWIPVEVAASSDPSEWRWGVRAAQRILQLELDVLRAVLLATQSDAEADALFAARAPIDAALVELDGDHDDFVARGGSVSEVAQQLTGTRQARTVALQRLRGKTRGSAETIGETLRLATDAFYRALKALSPDSRTAGRLPTVEALFGTSGPDGELQQDGYLNFLNRALAIEVIRRSFADDFEIEAAQTLHVAQLTPLVDAPLFTLGMREPKIPSEAGQPQGRTDAPQHTSTGPEVGAEAASTGLPPFTTNEKLAGIRLNHFAGFYRASWRENDFMWGRLDGAAAIARLLVDRDRARALATLDRSDELKPWAQLARALVPTAADTADDDGDPERRQLLWELLAPLQGNDPAAPAPQPDDLASQLQDALKTDLLQGDGSLTWAVCARALQYEALREEVPQLIEQTEADKLLGAFRTALGWQNGGGLFSIIGELRRGRGKQSLPARLGCDDPDEATSTLALRTLSHTMLVALAALAGALPLTRALQPVRVPLFTVQGISSEHRLNRVAVVLGYLGAACYLGARWLSLPANPPDQVPLRALWSPQVLTLYVALFAVIGVAGVPLLRALRATAWPRRLRNAGIAAVFLACGGAVALAWQWYSKGTIEALTAWHSTYRPNEQLLWIVVGLGGFHAASSLDSVVRLLGPFTHALRNVVSSTALTFAAVATWLSVLTIWHALIPALSDGGMKTVAAILAFAGAPLLAGYLRVWNRR